MIERLKWIFRLDINANTPPFTDDSQVAQIDQHSQRQELQSTPRQTLSDGARSNSSKDSDKLQRKNQLLLQLREFRMARQKQQNDASGGTNGTDETEIELSLDQNIHSSSPSHSSSSNQEWQELTRSTGSNVANAKHGKTSHSPEPDPNEKLSTNAVISTFEFLKLIWKN